MTLFLTGVNIYLLEFDIFPNQTNIFNTCNLKILKSLKRNQNFFQICFTSHYVRSEDIANPHRRSLYIFNYYNLLIL
jgi:hypothetical protein